MSSTKAKKAARENMVKAVMGKPRRWLTEEALQEEFKDYIEYCLQQESKRIPNIAGFCVYSDIVRETFYMQEEYYPCTYQKIKLCLEDQTINIKDTIRSIFLLKAVHGYRDSDVPASTLTINYNNVADKQIACWMKDANLIVTPEDDE